MMYHLKHALLVLVPLSLLVLRCATTEPAPDQSKMGDCRIVVVEDSSAPWLCCEIDSFQMCKPIIVDKKRREHPLPNGGTEPEHGIDPMDGTKI